MNLLYRDADLGIADARLAGLYRYWRRKCGERPMPDYEDIEPMDMRHWLANLVLLECPQGADGYRLRLRGPEIDEFFRPSGADRRAPLAPFLPEWRRVADEGRPDYREVDTIDSSGDPVRLSQILLPLFHGDRQGGMILGAMYFRPQPASG